jgi:hypothetical protein
VPARADGGAAPISPQPPSPASWGTPGVGAAAVPPADEVAAALDAFRAAAERVRRGVRGRTTAPEGPPAPDPEAEADEPGEPGLVERIRLNGVDAFYRGSLTGAGRLALMQHYASRPDEPGIDPQTSRWRDQLRKEYPRVLADLARYDRMRGFATPAELAAAAIGQVGGGLPSPESLVGMGAKGATWLWRLGKAGLQQGAVSAATDPVVQGLNIQAGVQGEYDPARTAVAAGTGAVTGAAARSTAEVLGAGAAGHAPAAGHADDPRFDRSIVDVRGERPPVEIPDAQTTSSRGSALVRIDPEALPTLKNSLRTQFTRALAGPPRTLDRLIIGEVSPEGAVRINAALKSIGVDLDVADFRHTVDASEARHVVVRHSDKAREARRSQLPITMEDWAMIPDILANPDAVSGSVTKGGLPGLVFEKRTNGYVLYVEEVRTGARTFAAKTMFKRRIAEEE